MAVHEDGTMDVLVGDKPERRRYTLNREAPFTNRYLDRMQTRYVPDTRDGEEVVFVLGSDTPHIVVVGAPDPLRYSNDEERYLSFNVNEFGNSR